MGLRSWSADKDGVPGWAFIVFGVVMMGLSYLGIRAGAVQGSGRLGFTLLLLLLVVGPVCVVFGVVWTIRGKRVKVTK